ncbi:MULTISPECIES: tail fiber assembly protein [unclassified Stenotrophomonas]|uniref:tail fiber assembly protein n=1 Tax=unclassified Stenotrophomonas TaxID=196198 RepID=UPI003012F8A6
MYAITETSYRAITPDMPLSQGETKVDVLPDALLARIKADQKRFERDQLLRDTDWTLMADAPLTAAQKTAIGVYRQQLRDLPALPGFPNVPWPVLPTLSGAAGGGGTVLIP